VTRGELLALAAGALIVTGTAAVAWKTRGERNRNPGNLRPGGGQWLGLSARQTDPGFLQFDNEVWGIRAAALLLRTYGRRGWNTLREIVSRWAPSSENDTAAYVAALSSSTGYLPDAPLQLSDRATARRVLTGIIRHENGRVAYPDATIDRALDLAGFRP